MPPNKVFSLPLANRLLLNVGRQVVTLYILDTAAAASHIPRDACWETIDGEVGGPRDFDCKIKENKRPCLTLKK